MGSHRFPLSTISSENRGSLFPYFLGFRVIQHLILLNVWASFDNKKARGVPYCFIPQLHLLFHGNTDSCFLRISGWFKHPLMSASACFYYFWHVISWTLTLPTLVFLRQMLFHQHQFSYLFTTFSSLILLVGDEKELSFHYQPRSINLKE